MNNELDKGLSLLKQAEGKADIYKVPPLNELLNHPVFDVELSKARAALHALLEEPDQ